ncbi:hypothetical protein [Yinghuangia sp. YIM S10712]|uniref:hypothetical protein n=1 Tax=Yinghuangia sp. YIM S10712 TaxID=3436930 RepID=UPI003F53E0E6
MSLPGADELFRTTGGATLTSRQAADAAGTADTAALGTGSGASAAAAGTAAGGSPEANGRGTVPAPSAGQDGESVPSGTQNAPSHEQEPAAPAAPEPRAVQGAVPAPAREPGSAPPPAAAPAQRGSAPRRGRAPRRPSGRERHDEKITVYVSAEELMDLEHARLTLRGDFGLAVDRGRIVREAIAVVLADLEARGEASILVRRLRGGAGPGGH